MRELGAAVGLALPLSAGYQLRPMRKRGIDVETRGHIRSR